jgi:NAD-dependent SIR2 family protein deacetylase
MKEDEALCHIHGAFYSGFPECPACKTEKEAIKEDIKPGDELVPPCVICGKIWQRKDVEKWCYHISRGVVCRHHHGVKEWYDDMIAEANKKLEEIENGSRYEQAE